MFSGKYEQIGPRECVFSKPLVKPESPEIYFIYTCSFLKVRSLKPICAFSPEKKLGLIFIEYIFYIEPYLKKNYGSG